MTSEAHRDQIDSIRAGLESYGYMNLAEPTPGSEKTFIDSLQGDLDKIENTLSWVNRKFNTRGSSRRALKILHSTLPHPNEYTFTELDNQF